MLLKPQVKCSAIPYCTRNQGIVCVFSPKAPKESLDQETARMSGLGLQASTMHHATGDNQAIKGVCED